jgi:beta propeller repeat protein
VVWQDYRSRVGFDIYLFDLATGEERVICTDAARQWLPRIEGDLVAWVDERNRNWDIYAFDLATGTEYPVCTQPDDQGWPSVADGRIVWQDYRGGRNAVYRAEAPA